MSQFLSEDKVSQKLSYTELFKKMKPFLFRHKWALLSAICLVILMSVSARLVPILIGYTIDHALIKKDLNLLMMLLSVYVALEFSKVLLDFIQGYFFQRIGAKILFEIREALISRIQSFPIEYFNKNPIGRIVTRATNDVSQLGELFSDGVVNLFVQFVTVISIIISLLILSPKLTFISLIFMPLFAWLSLKVSNKIRDTLRESKKKLSELNSFVSENLYGIKIIQIYNQILNSHKKFNDLSNDYKVLSLESTKNYALMMPLLNLFNALTITLAFYLSGFSSINQGIAVGSMVAFFLNILDIVHPFREIIEKYQQFQNSLTSAERVFTMLEEPIEKNIYNSQELVKKRSEVPAIEIKNLSFRYQENLPLVLKNLNIKIKDKESVAIIGRTGSGKSTLISLFQAFYEATHESIFIYNVPIEAISKAELRKKIAVVQQDNFIFKGDIWQNISLGANDISYEQVKLVCDELKLTDHLLKTNRNLYSEVEEKGSNLSAGERQLISFARILVFKPDILILDEATSNIDSASEALIQEATKKITQNRTSIIIAHRLSTIQSCDQIIVLSNGEMIETGNHESLMSQNKTYANMFRTNTLI